MTAEGADGRGINRASYRRRPAFAQSDPSLTHSGPRPDHLAGRRRDVGYRPSQTIVELLQQAS